LGRPGEKRANAKELKSKQVGPKGQKRTPSKRLCKVVPFLLSALGEYV